MKADAVGFAQRAAGLVKAARTSAGGAVAVVGQRLDDERDAARTIALVAHLLVASPPSPPAPRLIARSTVSFGMLAVPAPP